MIEFAKWLFHVLAPLGGRKNPQIAAVLGFLFGGIGLGIYFLSFVDFLIPLGITIVLAVVLPGLVDIDTGLAILFGSIVAALWGYLRVVDSNSRLGF